MHTSKSIPSVPRKSANGGANVVLHNFNIVLVKFYPASAAVIITASRNGAAMRAAVYVI